MPSIRQNPSPSRLPDFRNHGVWLRVLLATNAMVGLFVCTANQRWSDLAGELLRSAALLEPPLLASLAMLYGLQPRIARLQFSQGRLVVMGCVLAVTAAFHALGLVPDFDAHDSPSLPRALFIAAFCAVVQLYYFNIRIRLQSPALTEARLMALSARIRPHFLFNALNAVLGVIRSDPRRAEAALEELAELFRALMRDNRELVMLSEEIALARQYLDLERLRLGTRLQVRWDIESCPPDALLPPLMLQPLLENAVYHGIEPADQPGEISIGFAQRGDELHIEIGNPCDSQTSRHAGNQMALDNIRERLMLFFDLEARLETQMLAATPEKPGYFVVRIVLPYRRSISR